MESIKRRRINAFGSFSRTISPEECFFFSDRTLVLLFDRTGDCYLLVSNIMYGATACKILGHSDCWYTVSRPSMRFLEIVERPNPLCILAKCGASEISSYFWHRKVLERNGQHQQRTKLLSCKEKNSSPPYSSPNEVGGSKCNYWETEAWLPNTIKMNMIEFGLLSFSA